MTEPIPFRPLKTDEQIRAEAVVQLGEQMLREIRAELLEAETTWRRVHDMVFENACREVAAIDIEHGANISRLRAAIARIEAMLG